MKKNAKKSAKKKALFQPVLPLREFVKAQLFDTVVTLGMKQVYEIESKGQDWSLDHWEAFE